MKGFSHPSHSRTFTFSQRFINAQLSAQILGMRDPCCCASFQSIAVWPQEFNGAIDCIVHWVFFPSLLSAGSPLAERMKFWDTQAAVWTESKWMFHSDCCPKSRICHGHCVKFNQSSQLGVSLTARCLFEPYIYF